MTDEAALIAAARDRPDDQTPRLVYADWLDDHGQPERAAATRLLVPRPWRTREATEPERAERAALATALAARMDREEGRTGLAEYARRYVALCTGGQTTGSWHDGVDWVYNTLLVHWRRWLPPSVTTLARKAGRDAYNKDYFHPAITFPTRRRNGWRDTDPWMSVCFAWGLPEWVECDAEDWARAGADLIRAFPWVHLTR